MTESRLDIDLDFSYTDESGAVTNGRATAAGTEVTVSLDRLAPLAGAGLPPLEEIRPLADLLARKGVSVTVAGPDGNIVSLGKVDAPASQRLVTRSPHIKLGNLGSLLPLLRQGRRRPRGVPLLPPSTPLPLVPTVQRKIVRRITTTHYARGGGRPRLIFVQDAATWTGQIPREVALPEDVTTIGSGPGSDIQLEGLEALHAEIRHDGQDEYVLVPHGPVSGSVSRTGPSVLRTGARIQMGQWCLAFFREEFADHGRPYGGRSGGELAYERPQLDPRTGTMERDSSEGVR
ncbi:FHA domain-containing protein [Pseudarthrobacter sp. NIBRBAC000502770]|uniref:FHA domain-containing protein n=1 Tax=Pseudarthrobacter sp. NIBRBAC000502770 TaxID=2590785 RepID=UPI001140299D|nr:FHA domain-containing protein [Pseudarthrobacter sp. NIBRBAC000502770]QDG87341.1 FHA domain-containing protein [Pseudarthrobacter sp. NIBRBAC000502770]